MCGILYIDRERDTASPAADGHEEERNGIQNTGKTNARTMGQPSLSYEY